MWRQFMAIYGYILKQVADTTVPFVGVIERSVGTGVARAVKRGRCEHHQGRLQAESFDLTQAL
jgi:hypothetical protein